MNNILNHEDIPEGSSSITSPTHDLAGNRLSQTATTGGAASGRAYSYEPDTDRLASWTGGAYSYNLAGCVTRIERTGRPTLDLTWNGQYQLVSVTRNGVLLESYSYDALGRRVSTTTAAETIRHVYDDNWQCIADLDGQDNIVASYVWGEGIDNLLAVKIGETTYYALTDNQGTIWGYMDTSNNVVARWTYDAWGNVLDESVSVPALATLRYRFQGREWSAATGLMNFRARWYDPGTGRWLSKDPIGLPGGLNLYAFCGDEPLNYLDPSGTDCANDVKTTTIGSLGVRAACPLGGLIDLSFAKDSDDGYGFILKGGVGMGTEIGANLGIPRYMSFSAGRTSGTIWEQSRFGSEAHGGFFVGASFDLDNDGAFSSFEVGNIGGGAYKTVSVGITLWRKRWWNQFKNCVKRNWPF